MSKETHSHEIGGKTVDIRVVDEIAQGDTEAARLIVEQDSLLSQDEHTKNMLENGFVTPDGRTIDAGDSLYARRLILEQQRMEAERDYIRRRNPDAWEAASEGM
jgi:hypothetical protein